MFFLSLVREVCLSLTLFIMHFDKAACSQSSHSVQEPGRHRGGNSETNTSHAFVGLLIQLFAEWMY